MTLTKIGSIWRKWDLHVHTPFSALNNGYGSDWDLYAKNLFRAALDNEIHAIGITDYFTIEGYKKLKKEYIGNNSKLAFLEFDDTEIAQINKILIIPNIEFRLDVLIPSKKVNNRVNFHVLFSEEVPIEQIEDNFLHEINFIYEGRPQDTDETRKLKNATLIELGKKLREEQPEFRNDTDLVVGMQNVVVSSKDICEALDKSVFKNKYVLAVPADEDLNQVDWRGQGHNVRKVIIQKSDFLMASNPNTIAWGLGKKSDNFVREFKSLKPCIWGSDSHAYDELFVKNKDRILWVKSDLSFDGLRQIAHEPNRVFIGIEPESKKNVDLNSTFFLDRLIIEKISNLVSNEVWFDGIDIKLNSGLVAIIGNKGSGKTAIADIIALCGNASKPKNYSFLTNDRFNKTPEVKGRYFKATLHWADGRVSSTYLNEKASEDETEKINYIPQSFLEKLCLPEAEKGLFENELRKIIFSRIPYEKRLTKNSLDEIISSKTEVIRNSIEQTKAEIKLLNDKIIELEEQSRLEYKQRIDDDINALNKKMIVLCEKEPVKPELSDTQDSSVEVLEIKEQIETNRKIIEQIDTAIEQSTSDREKIYVEIGNIERSIQNFNLFQDNIRKFVNSQTVFLASNNINIDSIFSYSFNLTSLEELLINKKEELALLNTKLDSSAQTGSVNLLGEESISELKSLQSIKDDLQVYTSNLQGTLDQPEKEHEEYLAAWSTWNQEHNELRASIQRLEKKREYLNNLHDYVLAYHYKQRQELSVELFYKKSEILDVYKELYKPIIDFKDTYNDQLSAYQIDFAAAFQLNGFVDKLDTFINYGKAGSFYNKESSARRINNLIESTDFNNVDDAIDFLSYLIKCLLYDTRNPLDHTLKSVESQLKSNIRVEDVYNYIYNLEYLEPVFQLKLAGKEISSLSPGERGALLLIFYLLLDNDKSPLIIDQPEENLDNQSIYNILVPFIQEAKQRRQVIIVTHNPNLAVVCDADQIIHVKIDKNNCHQVTCTTGSIENPQLNKLIIEVLEGTFPAFDTRNRRYSVTRSRLKL